MTAEEIIQKIQKFCDSIIKDTGLVPNMVILGEDLLEIICRHYGFDRIPIDAEILGMSVVLNKKEPNTIKLAHIFEGEE